MNYKLKFGTKSEEFGSSYLTTDQYLMRFYFDVDSKPLKSLDADYSKKIPSPPIIPSSSTEDDPWGSYIWVSDIH